MRRRRTATVEQPPLCEMGPSQKYLANMELQQRIVDSWPKVLRELVHKHGFRKVYLAAEECDGLVKEIVKCLK